MPVTLQEIDRAQWETDSQVAQDLARIYRDAPAERLPAPVDRFIEAHFAQEEPLLRIVQCAASSAVAAT